MVNPDVDGFTKIINQRNKILRRKPKEY